MQSRSRAQVEGMRPGPVGPSFSGGGRFSPYGRSHTSYSRTNPKPLFPPSRKYEILMEAGRLATEYLVSKGVLPPNSYPISSNFQGQKGNFQTFKGQQQVTNQSPPSYIDNRARIDSPVNGPDRRREYSDYDRWRPRKNRAGKRKTGFHNKWEYSDWDRESRDRGRNRNSRDRAYSGSVEDEELEELEEEEEGEANTRFRVSGYSGNNKNNNNNKDAIVVSDDVASSVSKVSSSSVKRDTGSELEDTGSKVSSSGGKRDLQPEGEGENNFSKCETEVEKMEVSSTPEPGPPVSDANNNDNCNESEKDGLLKYFEFAKVPKKPRSVVTHNRGNSVDLNNNVKLENISNTSSSKEPILVEEGEEEEDRGESKVSPSVHTESATRENLKDEEMVEATDLGTHRGSESDAKMEEKEKDKEQEKEVKMEENEEREEREEKELGDERMNESAPFKTCDLNLTESPEITEIPSDRVANNNKQQLVDFEICADNNNNSIACETNYNNDPQVHQNDKVVPVNVIHIEDDSPVDESGSGSDSSRPMNENSMVVLDTSQTMESMLNGTVPSTEVIPDGFTFTFSDYLGPDISCYPSDLQATGITGVDDPIYGSLGDIGFMEVWDQPAQDYERFF